MNEIAELVVRGAIMGAAGAVLMDLWALVLRRRFNIATLDYALLGRWIGHFPSGRFVHDRIASATPVRNERPLGWLVHFTIAFSFAWFLLAVWGIDWARSPTLFAPMLVGLGTVFAPWLIMQPAMGAGMAGSRTPNPRATRLRNLGTHAIYGLGLYASAVVLSWI